MKNEQQNSDKNSPHIPWHPAFILALQEVLDEYKDVLEFYPEVQLTSGPLKIDCVVIKKKKDVVIKNSIAAIFREYNILEYKSPDDYVSIKDFYKVYGYACLYSSFNDVPVTSMTVSFVESHYPESLLKHLREVRSYKVAETSPGIYNVSGDILPIQIIDTRQLSEEENLWLKGLSNELDPSIVDKITVEAYQQGKAGRLAAYLQAIMQANSDALEEVIEMANTLTLDQVFEKTGFAARWEARGKVQGEEIKALDIAKNMIDLGFPFETVVSATQLEPEKVKALYQK